ncbi:ABC transporter ATP-binding protein [Glutamicibacter protophormiae]|uniref:Putative siderophore transport system ATP-binding protein YusV n=1 Tax=Kocuria varians TaxID=1272 RepID=A0A7D7L1Y7_KOCVA|nr:MULTISPECIES: ABC transporter ATP-binding protein [Kocuria]QMS57309.1 putative siderophore transport system ATP-binding protein YusV [Kocuria varians]RUP82216.1 ABC transporter ATP-binding protein [Kocuria sp. HSID17590]RUQ03015.1 ABC transporter ATP-binding protein [Kocuria sp. HSID17582]WNB89561.1 ABC transporter ATP-binding protein [Glutamicibacter protophormiae]
MSAPEQNVAVTGDRERTASSSLEVRGLSVGYGGAPILRDVSVTFPAGRVSALVGANGCGKSTLLRTCARQLTADSGQVLVGGEDVSAWHRRRFAQTVGFLPQDPVAPEGVTVQELVSRGRHPHRGAFGRWRAEDDAAVAEAIDLTGLGDLVDRQVTALSGGQRQRVWIALALAQQTDVLLLDEPTTYLDIARQVEILDILGQLQRARGITLVMVLHELSLAARYADVLVAVKDGGVAARGPAHEVMTDETVSSVFDMRARVLHDDVTGARVVIPLSAGRADAPAEGLRP